MRRSSVSFGSARAGRPPSARSGPPPAGGRCGSPTAPPAGSGRPASCGAAPALAVHHRRADRLLGAPVGRLDAGAGEECEQGIALGLEVAQQPLVGAVRGAAPKQGIEPPLKRGPQRNRPPLAARAAVANATECRPVKDVGEPCAGEPHARIDAAAGGNQASRARTAARPRRLPPTLLRARVEVDERSGTPSSSAIASVSSSWVLGGDVRPTRLVLGPAVG
jgi:hypothetical protein